MHAATIITRIAEFQNSPVEPQNDGSNEDDDNNDDDSDDDGDGDDDDGADDH